MPTRILALSFGRLAFLICALAPVVRAEPRLGAPEHALVPFIEDTDNYAVERGWDGPESPEHAPFGTLITRFTYDTMKIPTTNDGVPVAWARVRVKLDEFDGTYPIATVRVKGKRHELDANGLLVQENVQDDIEVWTGSSQLTTEYFDEITEVKALDGFEGGDTRVVVNFWYGHEQEIDSSVTLENITKATCESGSYAVYMNSQLAIMEWLEPPAGPPGGGNPPPGGGFPKDPIAQGSCIAHLKGIGYGAVERGVYFPLLKERDDKDAFLTYPYADPGHPDSFVEWKADVLAGEWFDYNIVDLPEIPLRPILTELVQTSDGAVIDRTRKLYFIQTSPFGSEVLVPMETYSTLAGAIAQLSTRGLDQLERTHAATLPYPLYPSGKQERLSAAAIATPSRKHIPDPPVGFDLSDAATYWVSKNPKPNAKEFAGYLAYKSIFDEAFAAYAAYKATVDACHAMPPLAQAICLFTANLGACVKSPPKPKDFAVRVTSLTTFFDAKHTLDSLGISDVTNVNLSFDDNQLLASQKLVGIDGFLEGKIDPADVYVEYKSSPINPCPFKPDNRYLDAFIGDSLDRAGWLTCKELEFHATDASGGPFRYDLDAGDDDEPTEMLDVSLASGAGFALNGVSADTTHSGTCGESWMSTEATKAVKNWEGQVKLLLAADWTLAPGQNETLERLLSPYALGIEAVTAVPDDTPAYAVHPLEPYSLLANIGKAEDEQTGFYAHPPDGLYLPYMTTIQPGLGAYHSWFCSPSSLQNCDDSTGIHAPRALNGVDPGNQGFDVSVSYTSQLINQALWAQAGDPSKLGSELQPSVLGLSPNELVARASALGFHEVVEAVTAVGMPLDIRIYQDGVPIMLVTTGPERLVYLVPNIIVELVSANGMVHATLVADVIDRDFQLELSEGGASALTARWGDRMTPITTTKFLPGCTGTVGPLPVFGPKPCADQLQQIVSSLVLEHKSNVLLDIASNLPAPQLFDAGAESTAPAHLTRRRRFLDSSSLNLFADLCDPSGPDCDP